MIFKRYVFIIYFTKNANEKMRCRKNHSAMIKLLSKVFNKLAARHGKRQIRHRSLRKDYAGKQPPPRQWWRKELLVGSYQVEQPVRSFQFPFSLSSCAGYFDQIDKPRSPHSGAHLFERQSFFYLFLTIQTLLFLFGKRASKHRDENEKVSKISFK